MSDVERKKELLRLVQNAIADDKSLRDKYGVGDKFRFIRDRLESLAASLDEEIKATELKEQKAEKQTSDEVLVYVYLYNAQGLLLPTWQKMVSVSVLYEHSVNRPIYADLHAIETYIRSKTNKTQHGYLTIAIKPADIISHEAMKDAFGSPLLKVREGCFLINKLVLFTHNAHHYTVSETGVLIKKD